LLERQRLVLGMKKQIVTNLPTLTMPSGMDFVTKRQIDHRFRHGRLLSAGEGKQGPPWRDS